MDNARMRLLMLTVGDRRTASTRYRALAHVPALEAAGFEVRVRTPLGHRARGLLRRALRVADLVRDARRARADLVFVQRKLYPPPFARRLAPASRLLVWDVDDAVDLPPPRRAADDRTAARYRRNFVSTADAADLVLCASAELERRVPHSRTARVPTPVDTRRFVPSAVGSGDGRHLGWVGHSSNFVYLEALAGPLRELTRRHPAVRLVVVADRPPALEGVAVDFRPWRLADEVRAFDGIDVGLMPLDDTPWARAKAAFKALQYMALAIPAVVSPVGTNRELIDDGVNGFAPPDAAAWVEVLSRLVADPELRLRIGAAGRRTVERDFSLEVVSPRLATRLRELVEREARQEPGSRTIGSRAGV